MNPYETLHIAEIFVWAVGLSAIYFGGSVILNSLRSWRGRDRIDVPSTPTLSATPTRSTGMRSSQVNLPDQRLTIKSLSNQGVQHSGTRHRRRR